MSKPVFAHTADTHLRSSQYSYSYRGQDFFEALKSVIDESFKLGVLEILHGGDFIDARTPASAVISQLDDIDALLSSRGMTMYAVTGNHERTEPSWVDLLTKIALRHSRTTAIQCIDNKRITLRCGMTVMGLPSMGTAELREFLAAPGDTADILMWHGMVQEFADFPGADAVAIMDFANCPKFKHVLLGDIHVHQYYTMPTGGIIGYPGSTELTEKGEDSEKKFGVFHADGTTITSVSPQVIKTRKVLKLRVSTEEELTLALDTQVRPTRDEMPMIFLRFNPTIPNVLPRFYSVMHPNSVFKAAPMVEAMADKTAALRETGQLPDKGIESFLGNFIPVTDEGLFGLATDMIKPTNNATALLNAYVDKEIN